MCNKFLHNHCIIDREEMPIIYMTHQLEDVGAKGNYGTCQIVDLGANLWPTRSTNNSRK
jgi:hypothetical protein